jgi:hypothetical protein
LFWNFPCSVLKNTASVGQKIAHFHENVKRTNKNSSGSQGSKGFRKPFFLSILKA